MFGDFTDAERDFLFDWETGNTKYAQGYVEGLLSGDTSGFFELPGGPIGIAVGATYREDQINDVPGEIPLPATAWQVTSAGITAGSPDRKSVGSGTSASVRVAHGGRRSIKKKTNVTTM